MFEDMKSRYGAKRAWLEWDIRKQAADRWDVVLSPDVFGALARRVAATYRYIAGPQRLEQRATATANVENRFRAVNRTFDEADVVSKYKLAVALGEAIACRGRCLPPIVFRIEIF